MKKSKIALKPYLQTIAEYCDTLSNEELADIIIGLAKDVPTSGGSLCQGSFDSTGSLSPIH